MRLFKILHIFCHLSVMTGKVKYQCTVVHYIIIKVNKDFINQGTVLDWQIMGPKIVKLEGYMGHTRLTLYCNCKNAKRIQLQNLNHLIFEGSLHSQHIC